VNEYKSFNQIPIVCEQPPAVVKNHDQIALFKPRPKEPVVDGDICWIPVDKVAARVVQKAAWFHRPPQRKPNFVAPPIVKNRFPEPSKLKVHKKLMPDSGTVEEVFAMSEVAPLAIMEHETQVGEGIKKAESLVEKAHEVVDACSYLVDHIHEPFGQYQTWIKAELLHIRETRMALESETRQLMSALKEVRTFFMDKDYELERARLAEFISLCERLKALKDNGFLDSVADTILKLSCPK
jgi:hypothetical protein